MKGTLGVPTCIEVKQRMLIEEDRRTCCEHEMWKQFSTFTLGLMLARFHAERFYR